MAAEEHVYAKIPAGLKTTAAAAEFVDKITFEEIPDEAVRIGTRCLLDGLGLFVAGSEEHTVQLLVDDAEQTGGRPDALLLGRRNTKVPAPMAARVLGTAGHAHDWDDSQVSIDPAHVYGLLTHPTIPPLSSALVMAQKLGGIDGKTFMLAFLTGFEVECKISEWMLPQHYVKGMHSSGTVGTFGAYAAAAKLLGLNRDKLRSGFGIAASFAAGIRCNFGTMTKPLHVGRAAENGVTAALLAARGFTADPDALDGPWGFYAVQGGGVSPEKVSQGFGKAWTIVDPGVSIKPYPCGVLTHPTIDLMLKLVTENDVKPDDIEAVKVYAGTNILESDPLSDRGEPSAGEVFPACRTGDDRARAQSRQAGILGRVRRFRVDASDAEANHDRARSGNRKNGLRQNALAHHDSTQRWTPSRRLGR